MKIIVMNIQVITSLFLSKVKEFVYYKYTVYVQTDIGMAKQCYHHKVIFSNVTLQFFFFFLPLMSMPKKG